MLRLSLLILCCYSLTYGLPTNKQNLIIKLDGTHPVGNNTYSKWTRYEINDELENRIINGGDAPNTPWVGRIITKIENGVVWSNCGASLVSSHWALTARHCVINENGALVSNSIWVSLGDVNWVSGQYVSVELVSTFTTSDHDIALLKLTSDVNGIAPIPVQYEDNINYSGRGATIYGWGQTETGEGSSRLKMANVVLWGRDECSQNTVCLNPELTNTNACFGDSGGPMVLEENGQTRQVGVASAVLVVGDVPCTGNKAFYTSTSYYGDWIRDKIQE